VLERLAIAGFIKPKTRFPAPGQIPVDLVEKGDAEIAIAQPMEILRKPGVELAGLLPAELQDLPNFLFAAGVLASAKEPQAARELIRFLSSSSAAAVFKANGMNPP
jgi:molybdate transport system substrate-binding protein